MDKWDSRRNQTLKAIKADEKVGIKKNENGVRLRSKINENASWNM